VRALITGEPEATGLLFDPQGDELLAHEMLEDMLLEEADLEASEPL
jgi:hypothetical protein